MKSTRPLRRLAVIMATVLFFWTTGIPTVSAADVPLNIGGGNVVISLNGSYTVTGSTVNNHITICSGVFATVTLQSVTITSISSAIDLQPGASVTLLLDRTNALTSTDSAGIRVPIGSSLSIDEVPSGGSVAATGGNCAAGIGGDFMSNDGGTVNIYGGSVTANGSDLMGAGIGGGLQGIGGTVNIYGGSVTATGGENAAGIGGGGGGAGNGGAVNIHGGFVTANGGDLAAGIGGGLLGNGGSVNISGGTVIANGGTAALSGINYGGAGIGGGYFGAGGSVEISGLNISVRAKGGMAGLDIGAGSGKTSSDGGTLSVGDGAHLTLLTGMTNILPTSVTLDNCTVDDKGSGFYTFPKKQPASPSIVSVTSPVFLRSTNASGVEIDVSALALPAGVTLLSKDFSGLPTEAARKTWTLSHRLVGANGTFHGKDYLALYDFMLIDENGKPVTGYIGRLTVRLPIPSGNTGNLHLLYYNEGDSSFTEMMSVPDNGYLTYSTTHLGCYLITGSDNTGEKPAIPETGSSTIPIAAIGLILLLTLTALLMAHNKIKK